MADDEKVMTPREHDDALIDEARKLGVTPGQLRDANAAGLSARLVAEARRGVHHWEATGIASGSPTMGGLQQAVSKLIERGVEDRARVEAMEAAWARLNRRTRAANGGIGDLWKEVNALKDRKVSPLSLSHRLAVAEGQFKSLEERLVALEQQLEGPFTCPDHEDLLQKVEAEQLRMDTVMGRLVRLERWMLGKDEAKAIWAAIHKLSTRLRSDADPIDAAVDAALERLRWVRPGSVADTPETLDPDLSDEAQMEARVKAVTEVIGEAIGVVKGVCEPSAVRAIVSHHLDHAMDAAKDAARVKSP